MNTANNIKDFNEYAEWITYCNQDDDFDSLMGDWYYFDDMNNTIYYGVFGNDNSPGASRYTWHKKYDSLQEYFTDCKIWQEQKEYSLEYIARNIERILGEEIS